MKMKCYRPFLYVIFLAFYFNGNIIAQINFSNQNQLMPSVNYSGVAIGVTDVNGDNLDDVIRFTNDGSDLQILLQGGTGEVFTSIDAGNSFNTWTVSVADVDHNGFADVMSGGYGNGHIQMADAGGSTLSNLNLPNLPGNFLAQGSNFVDINNDGFLDAFICHDNGESIIYQNNGDGTFSSANDWIDMSINGSSGEPASGNYGSVWTDFDNDGDVDLYIAKCRLGVSNNMDERRINKLFLNDGNNNFAESAEKYGLRIGWQSWTAEFQDIDNDGDFDCFITNHDYPSQLLENDGAGHFTDITPNSGIVVNGVAIQGFMRDFDNDGFVDLLVAGTQQYLYKNNGDKTFSLVTNPFDNNDMESCAIGDLNNDGHLDIYAGYAQTYNNPSNIQDVLWMNEGNDNNWFKVHLVGTVSNLDGVGARVEIYGDWGVQIREVRSGEGYGITNSLIPHFGLGTASSIDHVVVKWPSGIVDVIDNPAINNLTEIVEGDCIPTHPTISTNGSTVFCIGGSLDLMAPEGDSYFWSNGATTQNITVTSPGNYSVVVGSGDCYQWSEVIAISVNPDETPTIEVMGNTSFCEGGSVVLSSSEANAYTWSNGATDQEIVVTESGVYSVTVNGICEDFTSTQISVDVIPTAPQAVAQDVTVLLGEDAVLSAIGANLSWYDAMTGGNLLGTGATYTIPNVTAPTSVYVENSAASIDFMEPHDYQGNNPYNGADFNGELYFNVQSAVLLKSIKVITDEAAERLFELKDANGNVLASQLAMVPVGESRVTLDFLIDSGNNYRLGTNEQTNLNNLGTISPRLQRSNQNVAFPYMLPNLVDIIGTSFGSNRYYYFYDWEVQSPAYDCVDDRVEVEVAIGTDVVNIQETDAVHVFPNPGNGLLQLELNMKSQQTMLTISDVIGKVVFQQDLGTVNGFQVQTVDATRLVPGTYSLQIQTEDQRFFGKLVIQ